MNRVKFSVSGRFSSSPTYLGKADIVKHEIQFTNDTLLKEPFQIIPLALYEEV